jgi:hypothetical protein
MKARILEVRMGVIIALFNQKGGVGKTTTCANLSSSIAMRGKRVLAIDFDPQSNLSSGLGIGRKTIQYNIYHVIIDSLPIRDAIVRTQVENLDIVAATIDLAGAEIEMSIHPKVQDMVIASDTAGVADGGAGAPRESRIDAPVDEDAVSRVERAFPEFAAAYELDGLTIDQFDTYGGVVMTLDAFDKTGWQKLLTL